MAQSLWSPACKIPARDTAPARILAPQPVRVLRSPGIQTAVSVETTRFGFEADVETACSGGQGAGVRVCGVGDGMAELQELVFGGLCWSVGALSRLRVRRCWECVLPRRRQLSIGAAERCTFSNASPCQQIWGVGQTRRPPGGPWPCTKSTLQAARSGAVQWVGTAAYWMLRASSLLEIKPASHVNGPAWTPALHNPIMGDDLPSAVAFLMHVPMASIVHLFRHLAWAIIRCLTRVHVPRDQWRSLSVGQGPQFTPITCVSTMRSTYPQPTYLPSYTTPT